VLATDRALEPTIARYLGVPASRLRLIPNGIDIDWCDALAGAAEGRALRERLGIPPDDILLFSAGRLERNKGFDRFAAALGAWRERPGWSWTLAGDGPYASDVARAIDTAGVASRVRRVGRVSDQDLHAWYEAADLFVHPTLYEGSSLVTLEAMAHRRPVLASRAGGLPDKVRPGDTGWLVPPGDVAALANGLERAVEARGRWRAMGEAGRALARATFDWPVIERSLRALYDELLAGPRR
jgi:glycosyltransferase involved in cell wall biosynthesis